ncbi:MAG TPA: SsgA family sporulation/cell division regulator [Streptomyces sp.]|uniref:SsgA family sporulation/cell division regulator n=1 Tax=Streptomyces sp. TaxID=1931 RepID=UPI002CF00101|nr:SsgA family sporulation/cell division regulator [Streptomyces sp.]HWU08716.1 SsgA family sporulation/cell division regulator [Streptomyces sp.]
MPHTIQEHARARLITDGPDPRPVPVELRCDPGEPQAVRLRLPGGAERTFGLDLLERGLRSPATRGEIRIWPCGRAQLIVELHSPDGVAVLQFDKAPLIRFLARARAATAQRPRTTPATATGVRT